MWSHLISVLKSNDQNSSTCGPGQGRMDGAHAVLFSLEAVHLPNPSWSLLQNIYSVLVFMGAGAEEAVKGKIKQRLGGWPREDNALSNQGMYRTSWPMLLDPLCTFLHPALCLRSCPAWRWPTLYLAVWIDPIGSPCRRLEERRRVRCECLFPPVPPEAALGAR